MSITDQALRETHEVELLTGPDIRGDKLYVYNSLSWDRLCGGVTVPAQSSALLALALALLWLVLRRTAAPAPAAR